MTSIVRPPAATATDDVSVADGGIATTLPGGQVFTLAPTAPTPLAPSPTTGSSEHGHLTLEVIAIETTLPISVFPTGGFGISPDYFPSYRALGDGSLVTDILVRRLDRSQTEAGISAVLLAVFVRNVYEALRMVLRSRRRKEREEHDEGRMGASMGAKEGHSEVPGRIMALALLVSQMLGVAGLGISLKTTTLALDDPLAPEACTSLHFAQHILQLVSLVLLYTGVVSLRAWFAVKRPRWLFALVSVLAAVWVALDIRQEVRSKARGGIVSLAGSCVSKARPALGHVMGLAFIALATGCFIWALVRLRRPAHPSRDSVSSSIGSWEMFPAKMPGTSDTWWTRVKARAVSPVFPGKHARRASGVPLFEKAGEDEEYRRSPSGGRRPDEKSVLDNFTYPQSTNGSARTSSRQTARRRLSKRSQGGGTSAADEEGQRKLKQKQLILHLALMLALTVVSATTLLLGRKIAFRLSSDSLYNIGWALQSLLIVQSCSGALSIATALPRHQRQISAATSTWSGLTRRSDGAESIVGAHTSAYGRPVPSSHASQYSLGQSMYKEPTLLPQVRRRSDQREPAPPAMDTAEQVVALSPTARRVDLATQSNPLADARSAQPSQAAKPAQIPPRPTIFTQPDLAKESVTTTSQPSALTASNLADLLMSPQDDMQDSPTYARSAVGSAYTISTDPFELERLVKGSRVGTEANRPPSSWMGNAK